MSARTAAQALGDATSALVAEHDTIDVLARLMRDCQEVVPADAVGLVVATAGGELELLASTSHQTAELEIFQVAQDDGPCVESFQTGALVTACGNEAMVRRWPTVGSAIAVAGFDMVHSQPLLWRELLQELLWCCKSNAVNPLHLWTFFVTTPVRPRDAHELKGSDLAGIFYVRAAA